MRDEQLIRQAAKHNTLHVSVDGLIKSATYSMVGYLMEEADDETVKKVLLDYAPKDALEKTGPVRDEWLISLAASRYTLETKLGDLLRKSADLLTEHYMEYATDKDVKKFLRKNGLNTTSKEDHLWKA